MLKTIYPLPDQTPTQILERLYDLTTFSWVVGTPINNGTYWNQFGPFATLASLSWNPSLLAKFMYMRADMEIHFRINTNQFYSGALMVSVWPGPPPTGAPYALTQMARSWCQPLILTAQSQPVGVIHLPWLLSRKFEKITTLAAGGIVPWTVTVDICAPLRVASATAPSTVLVTVQARFLRPQLVFPTSASMRYEVVPQSASSATSMMTPSPIGLATEVFSSNATKAPPAEAAAPSGDRKKKKAATQTQSISGGGDSASMMKQMQSLLEMAEVLAILDKPEISDPITRVYPTASANWSTCDTATQSFPLTLYNTSYLDSNPDTVPGGKAWTFADIAMTPYLQSAFVLNAGNTSHQNDFPISQGPLGFCISAHQYWRSSLKVKLCFYCSSFISARVLFIYAPFGVVPTFQLNDNTTRLIDVKGDTTVEFTLPYVAPLDWQVYNQNVGSMFFSLYTPIMSVDTATDASIDVCMWTAAGPDCQFSQPIGTEQFVYGDITGPTPRTGKMKIITKQKVPIPRAKHPNGCQCQLCTSEPQCDIQAAFRKEFPPIVEGCGYMTDNHYVVSENTVHITDVLKRFTTYTPPVGTNLVSDFEPAPQTLACQLISAFLFTRGGVNYKIVSPQLVSDNRSLITVKFNTAMSGSEGPLSATGGAFILSGQPTDQLDVSVPWGATVPYYQNYLVSNVQSYTAKLYQQNMAVTPQYYTAVRDDYVLGWLIPPLLFGGVPQRKSLQAPGSASIAQPSLVVPRELRSSTQLFTDDDLV